MYDFESFLVPHHLALLGARDAALVALQEVMDAARADLEGACRDVQRLRAAAVHLPMWADEVRELREALDRAAAALESFQAAHPKVAAMFSPDTADSRAPVSRELLQVYALLLVTEDDASTALKAAWGSPAGLAHRAEENRAAAVGAGSLPYPTFAKQQIEACRQVNPAFRKRDSVSVDEIVVVSSMCSFRRIESLKADFASPHLPLNRARSRAAVRGRRSPHR
jgi:hypothetical protein